MRRPFPISARLEMEKRARNQWGQLCCERCRVWLQARRDYEIHHRIPEGLRLDSDRNKRLTAADGEILCWSCHRLEQTPRDQGDIARAKRREAKQPLRVAAGEPEIARRYPK